MTQSVETHAVVPPQGERKLAALLFVDLSGYTELVRRLDPEDVARTIGPLLTELQGVVRSHGGVVTTVAGDGFLAVFGVPTAQPDVAERGLRCADEIRTLIRRKRTGAGEGEVPDVHAGLAAGEVLVIPSDEPAGWSLIGSPINLASRLCDAAAAGEILLDDACKVLVAGSRRDLIPREVTLQGHDGPVTCWLVSAHPVDAPVATTATHFVDRTGPLDALDEVLTTVVTTGRCRVFRLTGDPGIGKTRLIQHWLEQHHECSAAWVRCADRTQDARTQLVDALTGNATTDTALRQPSDSRRSTERRDDEFPLLLAQVRRLLTSASRGQPTILVLDDLHAADPMLVDILEDLSTRPLLAPVLILATSRSDEMPTDIGADEYLAPIPDEHVSELLTNAFGAEPTAPLREAILARVGGHPLMTLQSAAYLSEANLVRVDRNSCVPVSPESLDVLPTSLRLFVAARIDRLPGEEKAALQQLSTGADPIDNDSLRCILGPDSAVRIEPLLARRLLVSDASGVRFAHQLVRDVAYASLPRAERARLHELQLESADADRLALRMHHALGWSASVAVTDREEGARAAAAAIGETLRLAEHLYATRAASALAAAQRVLDQLADHGERVPFASAALLTLTANALIDMGRAEEAVTFAGRAREAARLAASDALIVRALLAHADALSHLRRYHSARQLLDEAIVLSERSGDAPGRGRALLLLGDTYRHSDPDALLALTEEAHTTLSAAGDVVGAATCARTMAYWLSTSSSQRFETWIEAARVATPTTDLRGALWLARAAGFAFGVRLDAERSAAEAAICRDLGEMVGTANAVAEGLLMGVEAATALGDLDAATRLYREAVGFADSQRNSRMKFMAAVVGAQAASRAGDAALADSELQVVRQSQEDFGTPERVDALVATAGVARDRGSWHAALVTLSAAEQAATEAGFGLQILVIRARQLATLTWAGIDAPADAAVRLSDECRKAGAPLVASYVDAIAEQAALLRGDHTNVSGHSPSATLEEQGIRADTAALVAERSDLDAREAWRTAVSVWERLGYTIWLARAQARAGDEQAAQRTLDLINAGDEGRAWALQR